MAGEKLTKATTTRPSPEPRAHKRPVDAAPELAGQVAGSRQHPGNEARRHDRQHAADGLLGRERQAVGELPADAECQQHGEAASGPDTPEHVPAADLHDVAHEDGHDEGDFEAFTEADQVIV